MYDFLFNYLSFLLKVLTVVIAIGFVVFLIVKAKMSKRDPIILERLNETYNDVKMQMLNTFAETGALHAKNALKAEKKALKLCQNADKKSMEAKPRLFVLNFKGNLSADAVKSFREEVTALLMVAQLDDEVMVKLDSPGGSVIDYGLAAAQMVRIRDAGLRLVVCVDRVAASGGYMMACVAEKIYAAPFAFIGSIGVVSQMPNFNGFLKKYDIDVVELTSGERKRPLSALGEVTDQGKQHVRGQLAAIHSQFKDMVSRYRPDIDIDTVGNGDYWTAAKAEELAMVDALMTSDQYITNAVKTKDVYAVQTFTKPDLKSVLLGKAQMLLERCFYGCG